MAWITVEGWSGRVWVADNGKRTFYIRQRREGKRWDASTRCSTLRAALKELERFEADPVNYKPLGSGEQLVLDDDLIEKYRTWCRTNTDSKDERHLAAKCRYLNWWKEQLDERPLVSVRLAAIHEILGELPARKDRIVAIKHLYAYLRKTGQIKAGEDPTLNTLSVPQSQPEQDTSGKSKVIPEDAFRKTLPFMVPEVADCCRLMAGIGCHVSEVLKFIKSGSVEGNVLGFLHKNGHVHKLEVPEDIAAAARRLKASGWALARETIYKAIRRACDEAEVEPWTPGRFRHTFATTALEKGIDPVACAVALGHDPRTMLRFYATHAVRKSVAAGYSDTPDIAARPVERPHHDSGATSGQT